MAYQKLQTERALPIVYSDTINIPDISNLHAEGVTSAFVASELVVAAGDFLLSITVGDIVYNTTAGSEAVATVVSITSDTVLVLSANIMAVGETFSIYGDTNNGCVLYLGGAGNITVLTVGNDTTPFIGVLAGTYLPVQVRRVLSTGTTVAANTINALW